MSWKHLVGSTHSSVFMTFYMEHLHLVHSAPTKAIWVLRNTLTDQNDYRNDVLQAGSASFQKAGTYMMVWHTYPKLRWQKLNLFKKTLWHNWHTVAELIEATSRQDVQMSISRRDRQISFLCTLRVFVLLLTFSQSSCLDCFFLFITIRLC